MMQQNYRSSADNEIDDRTMPTGEGKSGGNAGAGKSGRENLGSEKPTEDQRFGSNEPAGRDDGHDDEGKNDAPGKKDEAEKKN